MSSFVLATGHQARQIDRFAASLAIPGITVSCVPEAEPLGTAGGSLNALLNSPGTQTDVLVCNGDSLALADLRPLLQTLQDATVDAALLGVRVEDASRFGTLQVSADDALLGFAEKLPGAGLVNGGVYLFRRAALAYFPARRPLSFEYDVFPELLSRNARIRVVSCTAPFLDIGTEESLARADAFIRNNMGWFG